ncbi:hypothetical protein CXB51_020705 [Gossypium anomalum]|uniref:Reverse transcriptase Ty1/copia-type domain-containing protein n=1 Tax=Gossypium anomalum TaxID=47600 RepID=A0A8J5YQJ3_9ROSI|nr:hypothetical protein CXB51_020705 [Gossypium anomalum]
MTSLKYEISLLDCNTRFALWQIKIQAVLVQMDLEDALLGIDNMPSTLTDEEKKRKDRKTLTQLHLHLSNENLQDVMKVKTAATLWKRLEQICMSKTLTSKLHMKQHIYAHRLEKSASVHEHLTVFKEILSNFEAKEVQYDKEDLGLIPLCSLPPSYSTFRDTILYSRDLSQLMRRQDRKADDDRGRTQERNPRDKSKGRSKSLNTSKTCNFCKKKGHIKSECYKLHNKIKRETTNQKGKQPENSSEADVVEDYSDGVGTIKVKMFDGVVRTLSDGSNVTSNVAVASSSLSDDDITKFWHMSLGHMSENGMAELSKRGLLWRLFGIRGCYILDGQGICKLKFCECCVFGKQKRVRFTRGIHNTKETLEYIHSDLWGSSRTVQVRRDHETLDSSSYSIAKWRCETNEQNDHGEGSITRREIKPSNKYAEVDLVDYTLKVFSPIVKHSLIRALLGIVAMHDLELEQLDVKTAFLYGKLEEDIYMQQPEGFTVSEKEDYVCLLKKSLYGLKQSPRQWYKRFDSFMTFHDFKRSSFDSCVCFQKNSDDMLTAAKDKGEIRKWDLSCMLWFVHVQIYHMQLVQLADTWRIKFGRIRDGVIGFVDTDFAGDLDRRRSLTGYVFTIGGCAISWKATLQTTVALSTIEAEYMAITKACKEVIWLKGLFSEHNEDLQINTVFCNSQRAIFLTKD